MKLFFLCLTICANVLAGPIFWEVEDEIAYKATSPHDIKELVNAYPIVLTSGVAVEKMKVVEIMDRTYIYIGETTCPENDPKLRKNFVAWSLCQKNGICIAPVVTFSLPPKDPCATR